jgi:hypothetical protein
MDTQLDLNATARKAERTIEKANPYLVNATFFIVSVDLAHPLGTFNEEAEKKLIQQKLDGESGAPLVPGNASPEPPGSRAQSSQMDSRPPIESFNENDAIFERLVYVFPYGSNNLLTQLYQCIN